MLLPHACYNAFVHFSLCSLLLLYSELFLFLSQLRMRSKEMHCSAGERTLKVRGRRSRFRAYDQGNVILLLPHL